ncbi:MAG: lipase family alpha/beta hydrolase, partial [Actinomycetota bacterium]
DALAARIRAAGRPALVVALPGDGTGDLRGQALALGAAAVAARAGSAGRVDVVGYSAGGVVARLWAKEGGGALARRVVTLGSPHHGTELARLAATYAPDACPRACQQLVPGSRLLTELNRAPEVPPGTEWVSVWTTQDETVTPPESARLAGATNLPVQAVCPGAVVGHGALPTDPVVTELVLRALGLAPDPVIHCDVGDATRGAPR